MHEKPLLSSRPFILAQGGHSENMVMDKNLVRRMEDIEALPTEEKDKVYYFIDMALAYNKTKKAFAH